ncbi:hypothetical protein CRUP_000105 [Coryphaenoides rupestris]|nr:hypothetical protein CRUP_000105 [Coryphaenoides rupestris]
MLTSPPPLPSSTSISSTSSPCSVLSDRGCLRELSVQAGRGGGGPDAAQDTCLQDSLAAEAYERRIQSTQTVQDLQHPGSELPLTPSREIEKQLEDVTSARRDLDDTSKHTRTLEKQMRILTQEKEDLHKDMVEASEKLKSQSKELKEAHSQKKVAMQEFSELNERLTDLRSAKQRLVRQLRDKEEELESHGQKVESLRLEVRKADRAKKERAGQQYEEEELSRREAQHGAELKALRKELRDAEGAHLALQKEILMLKDKLEKTRRER